MGKTDPDHDDLLSNSRSSTLHSRCISCRLFGHAARQVYLESDLSRRAAWQVLLDGAGTSLTNIPQVISNKWMEVLGQ